MTTPKNWKEKQKAGIKKYKVAPINKNLVDRIQSLVKDVDLDPNEFLSNIGVEFNIPAIEDFKTKRGKLSVKLGEWVVIDQTKDHYNSVMDTRVITAFIVIIFIIGCIVGWCLS